MPRATHYQAMRSSRRGKTGHSWYVDEAYVPVGGKWCYLYRAIDRDSNLVDSMLSAHLPTQYVLPTDTSGSRGDTVKIVTYKPETVQVATTSQIAGLLMLGDEQFPGWEASVDGQPAPILTVDEALRAVYVPAGSHTVTFIMRGPG